MGTSGSLPRREEADADSPPLTGLAALRAMVYNAAEALDAGLPSATASAAMATPMKCRCRPRRGDPRASRGMVFAVDELSSALRM